MFACACYPADDTFLSNVASEVTQQIRRISNHACVILWCGNNENEEGMDWYPEVKANRDRYVVDYYKLYIETVSPQPLPDYSKDWGDSTSTRQYETVLALFTFQRNSGLGYCWKI